MNIVIALVSLLLLRAHVSFSFSSRYVGNKFQVLANRCKVSGIGRHVGFSAQRHCLRADVVMLTNTRLKYPAKIGQIIPETWKVVQFNPKNQLQDYDRASCSELISFDVQEGEDYSQGGKVEIFSPVLLRFAHIH